ncbi:MAG TPA: HAD family hydrolase [Acidimicrobiales bacterium]|nr:HAD family hydrolase [Acidimicrobiales bacterium]
MSTNGDGRGIQVVAFDGDDTLWHSESHFVDAHQRFCDLIAPYTDDRTLVDERVVATEARNLAIYGYGAKAFTLSLIETALDLTGDRLTGAEVREILDLGKGLLDHPVELLDGVADVVARLGATGRRLIVVTKGDLFHQEAKVAGSGLADRFDRIEIVSEKDVATYRRVMEAVEVDPSQFLMIGNSVRSDVLPVVELGGHAAHLPYVYTWELEHVPDADAERQGFHELGSIRELPALVERLSANGQADPARA